MPAPLFNPLGAVAQGVGTAMQQGSQSKPRLVSTPLPSIEDYYKGLEPLLVSGGLGEQKGGVLGGGGQFYYGAAPGKIPEGSLVLRGPDLKYGSVGGKSGHSWQSMPTYQVVPGGMMGGPGMQQGPTLDLGRAGRENVFNTGDLKYAREQGMTRKEIRKAAESQGVRMSAKAKARLYKAKKEKG